MWECLKVIFLIFWGIPSQPGSLRNMREVIRRLQVDKTAKVFNTADEFVLHTFKAHLQAHICHLLELKSTSDPIPHPKTAVVPRYCRANCFICTKASERLSWPCAQFALTVSPSGIPLYRSSRSSALGRWSTHNSTLETMASQVHCHRTKEICSRMCPYASSSVCWFPQAHLIHSYPQQNRQHRRKVRKGKTTGSYDGTL